MPPLSEINHQIRNKDAKITRDGNKRIVTCRHLASISTQKTPKTPAYSQDSDLQKEYATLTFVARIFTAGVVLAIIICKDTLQAHIDELWFYLREQSWFQSAHFETYYTTVIYSLLMFFYPFLMHYIPYFQKFKIDSEVTYVHQTFTSMGKDLVVHITPLLVADMLIIKRYPGVPYAEIEVRKHNWIVTTRPLPSDPPNLFILTVQVLASVVLFDLFFTLVHYGLHKNRTLYKYVHHHHHCHDTIHAHVTNQLTVIERALQVISANYALKAVSSHPISRLVFVILFLWLLIENHTGYDLPWGPHRILPQGIMGGPVKHFRHHLEGHGHYQPFFNYLDQWLEKRKGRKSS